MLEKYNADINRGTCGVALAGPYGDFSLEPTVAHSREAIWDAACKAASAANAQIPDSISRTPSAACAAAHRY